MTFIDRKSMIRVTIIRRSQTQDGEGDYGAVTSSTLYTGVVADIQPAGGKLVKDQSGFRSETTHLMFLQDNLAGIEAMDIIQHGTEEYEVLVPADWREHSEYQLRAL